VSAAATVWLVMYLSLAGVGLAYALVLLIRRWRRPRLIVLRGTDLDRVAETHFLVTRRSIPLVFGGTREETDAELRERLNNLLRVPPGRPE
jgi:hypothetical protein